MHKSAKDVILWVEARLWKIKTESERLEDVISHSTILVGSMVVFKKTKR